MQIRGEDLTKITPDIIGPGIEEEYADALAAIEDLRRALGPRLLTNDTPDGRVLLEVAWLEQEITRRRLSIPVNWSYAGTVYYLTGSGELNHLQNVKTLDVEKALTRLYIVLRGTGLINGHHIPVVIASIDDVENEARVHWSGLLVEERRVIDDLVAQADLLRNGGWPDYRQPGHRFRSTDTPNLDTLVDRYFYRVRDIDAALFEGWRPVAARKPPLPAPVPGLPEQAPPLPDNLKASLP